MGLKRGCEIPGQELVHAADRMVGYLTKSWKNCRRGSAYLIPNSPAKPLRIWMEAPVDGIVVHHILDQLAKAHAHNTESRIAILLSSLPDNEIEARKRHFTTRT